VTSGWYTCDKTGKYLSLGSSTSELKFKEIMAYSQEAIHIKAKSATLSSNSVSNLSISTIDTVSCLTNNNCKAANVITQALRTIATAI
jgi:hypothetical protein